MKFTYEKKWRDEWFHSLSPNEKLVFLYFCDVADSAGYVERNSVVFAFETGLSEEELDEAIKGLSKGCLGVEHGLGMGCEGVKHGLPKGYWLKNHIKHQKCIPLRHNVAAHSSIIRRLIAISREYPEVINFLQENALPGWESKIDQSNPCPTHTKPMPMGTGIGIGIGIGKGECEREKDPRFGAGDDAHQKLVEHPALRGLTWEADLVARRVWPGGNYLEAVDEILSQAILDQPITKVGTWLMNQYAKKAGGRTLGTPSFGGRNQPAPGEASKRKVFLGFDEKGDSKFSEVK